MSWRTDLSHFDPDTLLIVEIAERFLQDYFGHSSAKAESVLSQFFAVFSSSIDESFVRHEFSWGIATAAHYCVALNGDRANLREWERQEGLRDTPPEALEYLRAHYWIRHSNVD